MLDHDARSYELIARVFDGRREGLTRDDVLDNVTLCATGRLLMKDEPGIRFHRFSLPGIEAMTAATTRSFPRHAHDQYGIGVVDRGGHASWSGKGSVEAGPGDFICVNPGEMHDGRAVQGRLRAWRILYIDPAVLADLRSDVREGASARPSGRSPRSSDVSGDEFTFALPVFADRQLRPLFDVAFSYAADATSALGASAAVPDAMAAAAAILRLVARLGRHSSAASKSAARSSVSIARALTRIHDDPTATVTLTELAREAGLSRYQLIRGFNREVGGPPHAYIIQRRLSLACSLIRRGVALADVAASSGFCDQSHLTRCFVRQFGISPRRYARRV